MGLRTIEISAEDRRGQGLQILLVEDNPGDVRLIEEGLSSMDVDNRMHVARNGDEGLAFLQRRGDHEHAPRPDLILLDLNLPGLSGHELLARVKEDPRLKEIPVVILTTSDDEGDLKESYRLQAAGFITKPVDARTFISTIRDLGLYWAGVVKLPPRPSGA